MDFEKLANQHKDAVYRQMLRVCGNREDAEDVLVEALLNAYRHLDQLRDVQAFRSWMVTIGKRVCWQLKEREALLPITQLSSLEADGGEIASHETGPESQAAVWQMKEMLERVLNSLQPEYREVYELRDLRDIPGEEVARRLDISLSAMKSRLHRARALVRNGINKEIMPTRLPAEEFR
jgi:RNA polymerase sigma-70 factor, ECF subfamily